MIVKNELDIMMNDVNNCPYTYLVSDENWLNFCLFFNECVDDYGKVDSALHYFRLKLNRAPATLEEMLKILKNDNSAWILCSERKARYHMYGPDGEYNVKFVSSTDKTHNMYEAIYNLKNLEVSELTGELVADKCKLIDEEENAENMGTYNYYGTEMKDIFEKHKKYDVKTYERYGNTPSCPYIKGSEEENWKRHQANSDAIEKYNLLSQYTK